MKPYSRADVNVAMTLDLWSVNRYHKKATDGVFWILGDASFDIRSSSEM